jgi:hypothetical protein
MKNRAGTTDKVIKVSPPGGRSILFVGAMGFLNDILSSFTIMPILLDCKGDRIMRLAAHYFFAVLALTVYGGQV